MKPTAGGGAVPLPGYRSVRIQRYCECGVEWLVLAALRGGHPRNLPGSLIAARLHSVYTSGASWPVAQLRIHPHRGFSYRRVCWVPGGPNGDIHILARSDEGRPAQAVLDSRGRL